MVHELLPLGPLSRRAFLAWAATVSLLVSRSAGAEVADAARRVIPADPGNYREKLRELRAGDSLRLAPGEYTRGLPLHGLLGSDAQPITVEGPRAPARAVFVGRPGSHTVSLLDSAYLIVRHLVIDGRGAAVDAVRAEGHANWAHHIALERLTIINHGASQQNSGISTKCPAWGWVVRDNTIVGAGTGMYFGDSDGSDPFFDSLIEDNRIFDPAGYGMQIKHQHGRPASAGGSAEPAMTVIRRNLITKRRPASAPELARPCLLVGHWPLSGAGAGDRYLIYRNLLFDNPSEALFQGEGNLAFYSNLLVNARGEAVRIQPHNHKPRAVAVFNNTIVAAALGVEFVGGEAGYPRLFEHNLIYGDPAVHSEVTGENFTEGYDRVRGAFRSYSSTDPGGLDLTPQGRLPAPQSSIGGKWKELPDAKADFRGRPQRGAMFGACLREKLPCR